MIGMPISPLYLTQEEGELCKRCFAIAAPHWRQKPRLPTELDH
jgi:hypothetical protein